MLQNNNSAVINHLARKYYKSNKKRNIILITAIILATVLITSACSIYYNFLKISKYQELREIGTTVSAIVTNPTDNQIELLKKMDFVQQDLSQICKVGKLVGNFGQAGINVNLYTITNWGNYNQPLVDNFQGHYPLAKNEIMMSTWLLNRLQIEDPQIGMAIPLSASIDRGGDILEAETFTFILSGFYTDTAEINVEGNRKSYVSEKLIGGYPSKINIIGFAFKDTRNYHQQINKVTNRLGLETGQEIIPVNDGKLNMRWNDFLAAAIVILFFMFDGYLIIYNINYISIAKDIRFYGLLKTLGTTADQIRRMIYKNMLSTAAISIPLGLFIGSKVSGFVVPLALCHLSGNFSTAQANGWILFASGTFSFIMIAISYMMPTKKVGQISPISATKYADVQIKKTSSNTRNSGKIHIMALKNIFRSPKKALLVIMTLFLGSTTFLVCATVLNGMTVDEYVNANIESDIALYNHMTRSSFTAVEEQQFTPELIDQFGQISGVDSMSITTTVSIYQYYTDLKYGQWLNIKQDFEKSQKEELTNPQKYMDNPEAYFWGLLIGIDDTVVRDYNATVSQPIDLDAFSKGEIALITDMNGNGIDIGTELPFTVIDSGETYQVKVGGQINFKRDGMNSGAAPWLIVSNQVIDRYAPATIIYSVKLNTQKGQDQPVLEDVIGLIGNNHSISRTSKIELAASLESFKNVFSYLAIFITIILSTIGILNFINTMIVSVISRRNEFATMEAIGATKKQIQKLVIWEGIWYAIITSVMVLSLGSVADWALFKMIKDSMGFGNFSYPLSSLLMYTVITFICCIIVPQIIYNVHSKQSVIERLRETE